MTRSGFAVHKEPIDFGAPGPQLEALLARRRAAVVWVSTAHLNYADAYRNSNPYLHAVVIRGIAADHSHVEVHDSMVVGTQLFSCQAVLTLDDLIRSAGERLGGDAREAMGFFYAVSDDGRGAVGAGPAGGGELIGALARQSARFFAEEQYREAIRRYQALCEECFAGPPERAAFGARRLFHHASVLYAVPSLKLMAHSLQVAGAPERCLALHEEVMRHWAALGVLALRFEATADGAVLTRITQRFGQLDEATERLWESVADAPETQSVQNSRRGKR